MPRAKRFEDLPAHIRARLTAIHPDDVAAWVTQPIPALAHSSILQVWNDDGGELRVLDYLGRIEGHLGC